MKMRWAVLTVVTMMAVACSNPQQEKIDALKKETIDLHDDVMPRLGEINTLSVELKKVKAKLENDTTDSGAMVKESIYVMVKNLDNAHDGMMDWMAEYEPAYESSNPIDSAVVYYNQQKALISEVKTNMETSIKDAEKWLDENAMEP